MTTPTDFADEVALPDFEDALWAELRVEHQRPAHGAPTGRDRRSAVLVAAVLVVAVLGAGAALVARRGADDGSTIVGATASSPAPTETPTTEAPSTTAVEGIDPTLGEEDPPAPPATDEARAAATDLREASATMVQVSATTDYGVLVRRSWADDVSGGTRALSLRGDGRPKFDLGLAEAPPVGGGTLVDPQLRAVDHCFGEWSAGPGPTVGGTLLGLADALDAGTLLIDGAEEVDGQTLIATHHLTLTQVFDPETGELGDPHWVDGTDSPGPYLDPDTLLPVLQVTWRQQRPGIDDGPGESRVTYSYVDRDGGGLDLLVAPVPAGFTEVDRTRTDDERAAALCW